MGIAALENGLNGIDVVVDGLKEEGRQKLRLENQLVVHVGGLFGCKVGFKSVGGCCGSLQMQDVGSDRVDGVVHFFGLQRF